MDFAYWWRFSGEGSATAACAAGLCFFVLSFTIILFTGFQYLKIGSMLIGILYELGIFSGQEKNQSAMILMAALTVLNGHLL